MATDIPFKITVDTDIADLSVGELKQAFKDLTTEINSTQVGTEKYKQTLTKLGDVKGALMDVKQQIIALDPEKRFRAIAQIGSSIASGFAAAQGAVALFGGESEDLTKLLVRVQAATALASGLQGLAGFSKALQTAGLVMKAFALSNPFTAILVGIVAVTAAIYAMVSAMDESEAHLEELAKDAERFEKIGTQTEKYWERRLKLLKAQGASIEEIASRSRLMYKQQIEDIDNSIKTQQALVDANAEGSLEKLFELQDKKKEILLEQQINELRIIDETADRESKRWDEKEERNDKRIEKEKKQAAERAKRIEAELVAESESNERWAKLGKAAADKREEQQKNLDTTIAANRDEAWEKEIAKLKQEAEDEKKLEKAQMDFKLMIQNESFKTIGELALAFAGKSEASQRRAFAINKAAGIAQTTVDTFVAAQGAYKSQMVVPSPDAPVRAAIAAGFAVAQGLARVAVIAKTQFGASASGGGAGSVNAPNLQSPQSQQATATFYDTQVKQNAQGGFGGFGQPVKAYVVEHEITSAQKTIKSIEERTTF
jgi:hypothetical protein